MLDITQKEALLRIQVSMGKTPKRKAKESTLKVDGLDPVEFSETKVMSKYYNGAERTRKALKDILEA